MTGAHLAVLILVAVAHSLLAVDGHEAILGQLETRRARTQPRRRSRRGRRSARPIAQCADEIPRARKVVHGKRQQAAERKQLLIQSRVNQGTRATLKVKAAAAGVCTALRAQKRSALVKSCEPVKSIMAKAAWCTGHGVRLKHSIKTLKLERTMLLCHYGKS